MNEKPPVWRMIKEAVEQLGGKTTYSEIKDYIRKKYGNINESTITCQTIICSVNHPSRIHYPENKKPRISDSQYDFLFNTGRGKVEIYNPEVHGIWEIKQDDYGKTVVAQRLDEVVDSGENLSEILTFPFESHLRDFIVKNIESLNIRGSELTLYIDETGRSGVEYPTDIGIIDILSRDKNGSFVIFELKLSRGTDKVIGQILRYMGWVKKNLAGDSKVKGIIVVQQADEKLKYAVTMVSEVSILEYEINFIMNPVVL